MCFKVKKILLAIKITKKKITGQYEARYDVAWQGKDNEPTWTKGDKSYLNQGQSRHRGTGD